MPTVHPPRSLVRRVREIVDRHDRLTRESRRLLAAAKKRFKKREAVIRRLRKQLGL
jgi:hypothetical protein